MAVNTQPATLSELRVDVREKLREASQTAFNTVVDRHLNEALHDMHLGNPIGIPFWAVRKGVLITHAPYTDGTVDIAAATRTTVTGTTTLWNTAVTGFGFNNARVGGKMTFSGLTDVHEVSAVGGDTSITLTSRYTGDALTAATYIYVEDEYALASDFGRFADLRLFSTDLNIPLIGPLEFRRRFPRNSTQGKPKVASHIQIGFSGTSVPQHRVILSPVPSAVYSIPYDYITTNLAVSSAGVEQAQMTADTDEPILPLRYRMALVYHAVDAFYENRSDDSRSDKERSRYIDFMKRISGDSNIGADKAKFVVRNARTMQRRRGRIRPRYETGTDFDEMLS